MASERDEIVTDGAAEFFDLSRAAAAVSQNASMPASSVANQPDASVGADAVGAAPLAPGTDLLPISRDPGGVFVVDPAPKSDPVNGVVNPPNLLPIPNEPGDVFVVDPTPKDTPIEALPGVDLSAEAIAEARAAGQWHLDNTGVGLDLEVAEVWRDYTGRGVTIAVYDNGVEGTHPDLDGNYRGGPTLNGRAGTYDPAPEAGDDHGTAVAGIIASEKDGVGTVGVAFGAKIFSVDKDEAWGTDEDHILDHVALMGEMDRYDVVNHSWSNYEPFFEKITTLSWASGLFDAVTNGRDGLGTVIVKSGGNARDQHPGAGGSIVNVRNDDGNTSLFTNSRYTLDVANVDMNGDVTASSTPGANLLVSAFGNGDIVTTDRVGMAGYPASAVLGQNYTDNFGGTSAATPMVSGIVALMLEANPNLGWRDVQTILANTARHVGDEMDVLPIYNSTPAPGTTEFAKYAWRFNQADNWNGGGMHFSNDYGFGLVDARAAVRLAETWTARSTSENEWEAGGAWIGTANITEALPREGPANEFHITVNRNLSIESIDIYLGVAHSRMSDLVVEVRSPEGTWSTLLNRAGVGGPDISLTETPGWTLSSNAFRAEMSQGEWVVRVRDWASDPSNAAADNGTITNVYLNAYGSDHTANDTYIYTDAFAEISRAAIDQHGDYSRNRLGDTDGGTDTINAAAVSRDVILDLRPTGINWIDTGMFQIEPGTQIENAIGGDGDDQLIGNEVGNHLQGGRGDDRLDGQGGIDTLTGGAGRDTFVVRDSWDTITDFVVGEDVLELTGLTHFSRLAITDIAQGARVAFGDESITLNGTAAASLTAGSFVLAPPVGQTFDGTAFWGGTIQGTDGVDTLSYASRLLKKFNVRSILSMFLSMAGVPKDDDGRHRRGILGGSASFSALQTESSRCGENFGMRTRL